MVHDYLNDRLKKKTNFHVIYKYVSRPGKMRHKVEQTDFEIFIINLQEKSFKMMFCSWQYLQYQGQFKEKRSSDTKIKIWD